MPANRLADYILDRERYYTDQLFSAYNGISGELEDWFNVANEVKEVWHGKMGLDPRNEVEPWSQVAENVFVGALHILFPKWEPIGLPIGSETRLRTNDAVLHIDLKTHREGDPDLDRTQDVRPEQISGNGDYKLHFPHLLPKDNEPVSDMQGQLGTTYPKLPPYYQFVDGTLRTCVTMFVVCAYDTDLKTSENTLSRMQVFCVPNGIVRHLRDYRDIFQAGKDGRRGHRYRINLSRLREHEAWRWRETLLRREKS